MNKKNSKIYNLNTQNNIVIYSMVLVICFSFFLVIDYTSNLENFKIKKCNETIFDYDKIEYYCMDNENYKEKRILVSDSTFNNLVYRYFQNINDSIKLNNIDLYYEKRNLNKRSLQYIESYLCNNKIDNDCEILDCLPKFRDILIFKKDSEIVGIHKICFECGLSNIVSEKYNSGSFNCSELFNLGKFLESNKN